MDIAPLNLGNARPQAVAPTAPPTVPSANGRARSIDQAASDMEGLFFSLLLKQMRQTLEPSSMFGSDNGDILGGLFDSSMGQHLAKSNALGIGNLLKRQWSSVYQGNQQDRLPPPAPPNS